MAEMSGSLLAIPGSRISRSTSRESFATDISVASCTSEAGQLDSPRNVNDKHALEVDDGDEIGSEMAQCREDVLQKMLQLSNLKAPRNSQTKAAVTSKTSANKAKTSATIKEKPLGSLYKSLSESDLLIHLTQLPPFPNKVMKHCNSQAWIPVDNVQALHCRRRHMQEMRGFNQAETKEALLETRTIFGGSSKVGTHTLSRTSSDERLSKTSNIGKDRPFLRKFRIPKDVGKRIRDDLAQKLAKHKHKGPPSLSDIDCDKGKPVTSHERNFVIFHWLQSLDEDVFDKQH